MQKPDIVIIPAMGDNYMYLVYHDTDACVIDPAYAQPVLNELRARGLTLRAILNTHHHYDHTGGNNELQRKTNCEIIGTDQRITGISRVVQDGDIIDCIAKGIQVIATPGHTRNDVSYYMPDAVFTGDTLFVGGCGRVFEGTHEMMWQSLTRLASLPDDTQVYCGHEYTQENYEFAVGIEPDNRAIIEQLAALNTRQYSVPSTIALEKQTNVFIRSESAQEFAKRREKKDRF